MMNRKFFLATFLPGSLMLYAFKGQNIPHVEFAAKKHSPPPYLQQGDLIGISCPAGYISVEDIQPAIKQIESWGFRVEIGKTVGKRDFTFGGTDDERCEDLQQFLDRDDIKAVLCARGGYGMVRIIDRLDFTKFNKKPKWLIGFSDITVLHCHLNRNSRWASIHSKMCNSFPKDWDLADSVQQATIKSIEKALKGEEPMVYQANYKAENRLGKAVGELIGGNLRCIENLSASISSIDTAGKILFLEDVGEYLYSIDRMFFNLLRSGELDKLAGLIIGGFRVLKDDEGAEFGKSLEQIVLEKVSAFQYPVCFDFPVGHQKANYALKCGLRHVLEVGVEGTILTQLD